MTDTIPYGQLMHRAMRGLMRELLIDISKAGHLPGEHHFFITFDTNHPGVDIADWLRERYPEDMTVVMQHWFDNLVVSDDRFAVTLNFGDQPEPLVIPFDAIRTFVDPSVEFGLRFETHEDDYDDDFDDVPESPMIVIEEDEDDAEEQPKGDAEIVSLDSFRKH
ncbi:SspB family protein [Neptunicoccus sediminis]|uniref:SspB family protein n=1 Tax=Neptunicoccus sediminis TaxID=1892596 RepID=UPI000845C614|nr:ClpXP protease specificity-enhancing factor SspB [Neptunicoccus sediminis]